MRRGLGNEILAIAGKEVKELVRQPWVLAVVVLGPFLILAAFGLGYRNEELALRTVFVGPTDGPFEDAISTYTDAIDEYVVPVAFTDDLVTAAADLRADRVDLVIVLPPRPAAGLEEGRRSEIAVLHNSIDPIEQIGIEFATEVAVRELNATVVTAVLDGVLETTGDLDQQGGSLVRLVDDYRRASQAGDDEAAAIAASQLVIGLDGLRPALDLFDVGAPGPSNDQEQANGDESGASSSRLVESVRLVAAGQPGALAAIDDDALDDLQERLDLLLDLDATVVARPFTGDAESLVRERVTPEDHVAPGATVLLIQHLSVSLAALSLVRDRRRGLMTEYQIGPTSVASVMLGKLVSLSGVGFAAGALLLVLQTQLLGVPMRGSPFLVIAYLAALVLASVGIGLVIATVSTSELYASQVAMLLLLIAFFFSGFLLDLERLRAPFDLIGTIVPATPALEALRWLQLRGVAPPTAVAGLLAVQIVASLVLASLLLTLQWRRPSRF